MSGNRPEWLPTASQERLRARAKLLDDIRAFFRNRAVLEVETPYLSAGAIPDPNIESIAVVRAKNGTGVAPGSFLHTSPEFAMKRLLASGVGDIYQIARVFRDGENGRRHNPEFTLLEWYRLGFDHWQLMAEVGDLVTGLLPSAAPIRTTSYSELFLNILDINPLEANGAELADVARRRGLDIAGTLRPQQWLDLLFTHYIEPELAGSAVFVHGFPAAQAALARLEPDEPRTARRFELFVDGMELANGFHELLDAEEQRRRFSNEQQLRHEAGLPEVPIDQRFLAALDAGLPDCAGVALGVDRLLMLIAGADCIDDVLAFPIERA